MLPASCSAARQPTRRQSGTRTAGEHGRGRERADASCQSCRPHVRQRSGPAHTHRSRQYTHTQHLRPPSHSQLAPYPQLPPPSLPPGLAALFFRKRKPLPRTWADPVLTHKLWTWPSKSRRHRHRPRGRAHGHRAQMARRGAARLHACRAARRNSGTFARAARFLASWAKGEPGQPDGQAAAGRALRLPHTRAIHVQEHSVPENVWAGQ